MRKNPNWTLAEERLLRKLIQQYTYREIADIFEQNWLAERPGFEVKRSKKSIARKAERLGLTSSLEQMKTISEIQSKYINPQVTKRVGILDPNTISRKILSLSDIHFPFARVELIEQIIEQHSDANICVLNGDLFDGYSASHFKKRRDIPLIDEYLCVFDFVYSLSTIFDHVFLIDGNHDIRLGRKLQDLQVSPNLDKILRPNLLYRIANGEVLDNEGNLIDRINMPNVHYSFQESWYVKIGKTIFAHPWNKGSSKPGYSVGKVHDFFKVRYSHDEYDSIVIGHTHKIYKGVINSKLLIEQGCLSQVMEYAFTPRMQFSAQNSMNGYCVIYQDKDGNTDFNLSGPIFLGEAIPPKKDSVL